MMKQWMYTLSMPRIKRVRTRFLIAMIMLSLPSLFLLGFISYNVAKQTLVEISTQTNLEQLQMSGEVADLLFKTINNLHISIVMNDGIKDALRGSNAQGGKQTADGVTLQRLKNVLSSSSIDSKYISSVCLLDLDFRTYCEGRSDEAGIYEIPDKVSAITASDWYLRAVTAKGKIVYYHSDVFGTSDDSFSTVKLFRDADDPEGRTIGLLIINISDGIFNKIFSTSHYGSYMALDTAQAKIQSVYGTNTGWESDSGTMPSVIQSLEHEGYLVNTYRNSVTGWTFIHMVESSELLKQSRSIGWATTLIATFIGIIALVSSYTLSGTITRPLLRLKKMMVDWTLGHSKFPERFAPDEVGVIAETFRRVALERDELNERLLQSKLKEREAELRALQSQIKPHFLYNTLDSIYWMATLKQDTAIAQMAVSLSESFKLSLNKGQERIPVYMELKHIEHYLNIQRIRFGERFTYIEEVDEAIKGMSMMKLMLQPLVENAIYHGLEPQVGEGTLRLRGILDEGYMLFIVEDNGVGMKDISRTQQGFGLRNVQERLNLTYGASSTFQAQSELGQGTRVTLRFPAT